jgi:hypothetical protein
MLNVRPITSNQVLNRITMRAKSLHTGGPIGPEDVRTAKILYEQGRGHGLPRLSRSRGSNDG